LTAASAATRFGCRFLVAFALVALCPCEALATVVALHVHAAAPARPVPDLTPVSLSAGTAGPVADPLAANGFTSPSCSTASLYTQLSATAQRDCEVSGVDVAPVPLSNYAFDTNVDSGLGASFGDDVDSIVQDLLVTPVWTAVVWLVHVAVVALEWCYTIDLLAPKMLNAVVNALNNAERIFTQPWLGLALACAGIAFAWNGLIRRRVAETLGQALLMSAMIALGLWIIADPVGTVGAVSQLSDEAALGTIAATTTGDASHPVGSLDDALGGVFDSAITGPWCYLEFGDVDWCREPSQLDPQLERTGHALEQLYGAGATCHGPTPGLVECLPSGSAEQRTYAGTALALSAARTNGALFLALPANGLARNDLASQTSLPTLYGALCGSSDPTGCSGGTAPQAEFRTAEGTWPRAGGVLLIAIGAAGMLAMLGFIALRLLGAALAVLVYLLLAPLAVLAPAFGDSGRDTFRHWLTRLVGATLAKLVYSVMLGVTLLVVDLLTSVNGFGWWTQWLLISAFWWLAFEHRHRMLAFVVHERGEQASRLPLATRVRYGTQAVGSFKRAGRFFGHTAGASLSGAVDIWQQARGFPSEPGASPSPPPPPRARYRARANLAAQVERSLATVRATRFDSVAKAPALRDQLASLRARRERLTREEHVARGEGERGRRRAESLAMRRRAVDEQIARRNADLATIRRGRLLPRLADRRDQRRWSQQLDWAARSDPDDRRRPRDYSLLAGLAGLSPTDYERSSAAARRQARLEIDRQLAERRRWLGDARQSVWPRRRSALREGGGDTANIVLGRRARQFGSRAR
jgi:hypothetical protein